MLSQRPLDYGLAVVSLLLYVFIGFGVERQETIPLFTTYGILFSIYLFLTFTSRDDSVAFWFGLAIVFRAILVFTVPNLSDDFYRFIWDGRLMASGYHPFAEVPSYYMDHNLGIPGITQDLFEKLNSPEYFTVYPPVAQYVFWLAAKLSPDSIYGSLLILKTALFLAEMGTLYAIRQLLIQFELPPRRLLLYALNPLVVLELVGNVHLEAVMICCLLLALHFLLRQKKFATGILFAAAICVKLIPLIFLPALIPHIGWKRAIGIYSIIAIVCVIFFLPFWNMEIILGFRDSIGYYFRKFEFNASIYYIVREWGYRIFGYNIIQTVGWKLGLLSFCSIMTISFYGSGDHVFRPSTASSTLANPGSLMIRWILILLTYFLFTTTLHPWYVTTLLGLTIFTGFRFPLLWTLLVVLTYFGYTQQGYSENLALVALEYALVLGYFVYEVVWRRKYLFQRA